MKTGCLEEGTVLAFLGGTLAPTARQDVEQHVGACGACADLVTWAAADQANTTGVPGGIGRPFVGQLPPGARVGRYQILGALGRGGMGEVYSAYHPDLDRRIALKVVQGFGGDSSERRSRLLREARAIARLSHPNVVTVHDAGTFGDHVFIAMELIDGQTIDQWLRAAPRTWQQALDVFIAAGRGLAAAHAAGVIHRDFKPQNVMVARDGSVRVTDFGLARLDQEDAGEPANDVSRDLSKAVAAAEGLTPVSRCADMTALRSAVPLPRDEEARREVNRLRRAFSEVRARFELGHFAEVLTRAQAIRPEVEAAHYQPLLAELLNVLGTAQSELEADASKSEATLRAAMVAAEESRDDLTAAMVASNLVYVAGYRLGRVEDAEFWAKIGHARLDRAGGNQGRTRAWLLGDLASVRARVGDFEGARVLLEQAAVLKERLLGLQHPDVAISNSALAYILTQVGRPAEGLVAANRAIAIPLAHGDPDNYVLAAAYSNRGDALNALGRYADAEAAFESSLRVFTRNMAPNHTEKGFALHGLGEAKLARGETRAAVGLFEDALRIRRQPHEDPALAAETEFGLARALWASGGNRTRARKLAGSAAGTYRTAHRAERERVVETWLAERARPSRRLQAVHSTTHASQGVGEP